MSDESEDEIGAITSSIRKRNKKSLILSDDSEDENAEKFSESNSGKIKIFDDTTTLNGSGMESVVTPLKNDSSGSDSQEKEYTSKNIHNSTKKNRIKSSLLDSSDDDSNSQKIKAAILASNQRNKCYSSSEEDEKRDSDEASKKLTMKTQKHFKSKNKSNKPYKTSSSNTSRSSSNSPSRNTVQHSYDSSRSNSPVLSVSDVEKDSSRSHSPVRSSEDEIPTNSAFNQSKINTVSKHKKQSRKSKETALREIYSESSRMLRESAVGLPYHRPRQRTLDEFLNRKKTLPDVLPVLSGIKLSRGSGLGTKNSAFLAEEAERILQEREKMAELFFKEESEEEDTKIDSNTNETNESLEPKLAEKEVSESTKLCLESSEDTTQMNTKISKVTADEFNLIDSFPKNTSEAYIDAKEINTKDGVSDCDKSGFDDVENNQSIAMKELEQEETESFRLFLEPDDESSEDISNIDTKITCNEIEADNLDLLPSNVNGLSPKVVCNNPNKINTTLSKLAERLDLTKLEGQLADLGPPKLGKTTDGLSSNISSDFLLFNVDKDDYLKEDKGLSNLKDRFVKHVKCKGKAKSKNDDSNKPVEITIVRKETDSEGHEHLRTEKLNYISNQQSPKTSINFEKVHLARRCGRFGAQHVSLKMVLKEKIAQKRKQEWLKREEQKALDNEENGEDNESAEDEEEEILDDDEMSEEDSEEEEEEGIDWEDEEARLREIDRRNKRKRIKQGSFLDDEAEDDDIDDELNDSLDETPRTEKSLISNEPKFANGTVIKDKTDEVVSDILARSTSLPDTEDLLISDKLNQKSCRAIDNNSLKDTPIHPMFSKASKPEAKLSGLPGQDKTQSTPVPVPEENTQSNQNINWTPLVSNEASLSMLDKTSSSIDESSMSARKKLGFEGLFDTTDPKVDDMDDVIGLCSGQFMTQHTNYNLPQDTNFNDKFKSQDINPRDKPQSTPTEELFDTPDTVILTQNLSDVIYTGNNFITTSITDNDSAKSQSDKVKLNGNTVGNDDYQPGFMEDNTGVNDLLSSSEDESNEKHGDKKMSKKMRKKKRKRLVLSDDDSDSNDVKNSIISDDEKNDYQEKEVYYDSEENEIEAVDLDMEQKDTFKGFKSKKGAMRREFVEQEAELSGDSNDEFNISDDEDERGLDKLMLEEGDMDEECADEDKLRDQVGRLHHRAVLDEDQREIKLFQEAFLEDGELHSDNTRARKFRWKDTEDDTELERRASDEEGEDIPGTNVQDEKWRVERLEREKWVKESEIDKISKNKIREDLGAEVYNDEDSDNDDSQFFSLATKALKKLNRSNSSVANAQTLPLVSSGGGDTLISIANDIRDHNTTSKEFKSPKGRLPLQIVSSNSVSSVRGSFLSRGSSQLEKLAEMTKSSSETRTGTGAKKSSNFVFAILSPKKSKKANDTEPMPSISAEPEKLKSKAKGPGKPDSKKIKIDRSIDENSSDTIFGHM